MLLTRFAVDYVTEFIMLYSRGVPPCQRYVDCCFHTTKLINGQQVARFFYVITAIWPPAWEDSPPKPTDQGRELLALSLGTHSAALPAYLEEGCAPSPKPSPRQRSVASTIWALYPCFASTNLAERHLSGNGQLVVFSGNVNVHVHAGHERCADGVLCSCCRDGATVSVDGSITGDG